MRFTTERLRSGLAGVFLLATIHPFGAANRDYVSDGMRHLTTSGASYDLLRERMGAVISMRHWVNLGGFVTHEVTENFDSTGEPAGRRMVVNIHGRGASPIGRMVRTDTGDVTQFFIKNHLGSTVRVVNADGSHATTPVFDYQPYGELQAVREDMLNPVSAKFTGKEIDPEVNLHYFGARWYDQELGIWISPDPAHDGFHPYGYVGGNPISFLDPHGLWKLGVGVVVGWNRRDGWSIGFGVAADDINLGVAELNTDVSHSWNQNGSQTSTVQLGAAGCAGVCLGGTVGGSYNTESGYSATLGGSVGVGISPGLSVGLEGGTNHYWTTSGRYLGGDAYGGGYAAALTTRVSAGYSHGFGKIESGYYGNASAGGLSASHHSAYGSSYGANTRVAYAGRDSEKGWGYSYTGRDLVEFIRSDPQIDPAPKDDKPTGWFNTNWCGPGGGGSTRGALNAACHRHDAASDRFDAVGVVGTLAVNDWGLIAADFKLAGSAFMSVPADRSAYGYLVGAAYLAIGSYKSLTRITTDVSY